MHPQLAAGIATLGWVLVASTAAGQVSPQGAAPSTLPPAGPTGPPRVGAPGPGYPGGGPGYWRWQPLSPSSDDESCRPTRVENWDPSFPVPPGYVVQSQRNAGLITAGSVVLGTSWLTTSVLAGISATSDAGAVPVITPVIGPFIGLGTVDLPSPSGGPLALLVSSGLVQTFGLSLLIAGLAAEDPVLVVAPTPNTVSVAVEPTASPNHAGVTLKLKL